MIDSLLQTKKVPNQFPTTSGTVPYRIAFVGEAPGENEEKEGQPFVGASGKFLTSLLIDAGIQRSLCYFGNVCQHRPPGNKLSEFSWDGPQIQSGLQQLKQDIAQFQPNLIVLLGATPLRAAKGQVRVKKWMISPSISDWRGSLFICDNQNSPFFGFKCLPTYHPASLFRVYDNIPFVRFDLAKARKHGCFKELPDTGLILDTAPVLEKILSRLSLIKQHHIPISIDIEGYVNAISCLSISPTPKEAFIIPFENMDGTSYWSLDDECKLLGALAEVLEDPLIPKILQNGMYDRFVLAYSWKLLIRNMKDDTMLKHWEIYSELGKSLALQTSIYTDHAYYKADRDSQDQQTFWTYCCKDSAITNECNEKQNRILEKAPRSKSHYEFNTSLLDPFLYIELKGMKLDFQKKAQKIQNLKAQAWFDNSKKESGGTEQRKLEEMVGWQINVFSTSDMRKLLYEQLTLPIIKKERPGGAYTVTTDAETLLVLGHEHNNPILTQALKVRRLRKKCSGIEGVTPEPNGRVLSSTNIVGAKTGRTSSSKAPTGDGTNLQTIPKDDRDMFIADEGHDFCQCDLEGADSWTVAAHCAKFGDSTMLDDLLFGLKPAKVLLAMIKHGMQASLLNRAELKTLIKSIDDPDAYFICKGGSHGTNYRMGPKKLAEHIFKISDGEIKITKLEAKKYQDLYLARYKGVHRWHEWIEHELKTKGYIISASGHRRLFFNRKDASDTIGDACSTEPQGNTTYVTNLALLKLWNSPANRNSDGSLKIWPCHQVHDALCMQWKKELRNQTKEMIKDFFNNPITIAGIQITIPFEGRVGPSWGEQNEEL